MDDPKTKDIGKLEMALWLVFLAFMVFMTVRGVIQALATNVT